MPTLPNCVGALIRSKVYRFQFPVSRIIYVPDYLDFVDKMLGKYIFLMDANTKYVCVCVCCKVAEY